MASEETPPAELGYEVALAELDRLVVELDAGSVDVDTLSKRFKRAIDIVEDLDARIIRTREQVESLTPRLDAVTKRSKESDD